MNNNKYIPEKDHVARYCRPKHVQDDEVLSEAFELRPKERYLSSNWMEYFQLADVCCQIKCVRQAMRGIKFTLSSNGKFARLNVGKAKSSIKNLQIKSIPENNNPSHAGIYNTDEDESVLLELAHIIQPKDIFPAV